MAARKRRDRVYRVFEVSCGWAAAARGREGLCAFGLPEISREIAEKNIRALARKDFEPSKSALRDVVSLARRYFHGWRTNFGDVRLDLSAGTAFQRKVWSIVREIPYGEVRTYRWIALELGRPEAARAIGGALAANPVPLIVPCHRIVNANGTLGGFSAGGGVTLKRRILELERVPMAGEGTRTRVLAGRASR